MVTFVLDASAILRFLDGEAGVVRVKDIFRSALRDECKVVVSAVNWGEVVGKLHKRHGPEIATNRADRLLRMKLEVVSATAERAARSGILKVMQKIPYADAFGVELAGDSADHVLITADFDVLPAANDISIEFLPIKPPTTAT
jgi:PIN domain nuclease of toxin-antitoxin system